MIDKALALVAQGYKVFPLVPDSKKPAIKAWQKAATTDPEQVKEWWSAGSLRNIGIHCIDMAVLDIDVKNGVDGYEALKTIPHTPTLTSQTPTGGAHLLYTMPPGHQAKNKTGMLEGIDVRAKNGYIVAPGSILNGIEYKWANPGTPINMIPPALFEMMDREGPKQALTNNLGPTPSDFNTLPDKINARSRDDLVYRHCCSWRARNLTWEQAGVKLQELWPLIEQPVDDPFTWDEAMAKLYQAWKYPPGSLSDQIVAQVTPALEVPPDTDMTLPEMLKRFVFITKDSQVGDLYDHSVIKLADFKNRMKPSRLPGKKDTTIDMVSGWLLSKARQTVDDVVYYPDESKPIVVEGAYTLFNTYRATDLSAIMYDINVIQPFLDHLEYILPDKASYELFLNWAALSVQKPWIRIPWAFLIVTPAEGIGKGIIFWMLKKCVGRHNTSTVTKAELASGAAFNGYMSDTTMVMWDEIKAKGMDYDSLKYMVTTDDMEINRKYGSKGQERVWCSMLMLTNHQDALQIPPGDRRFYVAACYALSKTIEDPNYYERLFKMVKDDDVVPGHFLSFLQQRDISKFKWGHTPPMTDAKQLMTVAATSSLSDTIEDMVAGRIGPCQFDVTSLGLISDYLTTEKSAPRAQDVRKNILKYMSGVVLPQKQYTVPTTVETVESSRVRCICIRNHKKWLTAGPAAIGLEYARSRAAATAINKTREQIITDVNEIYKIKEVRDG